MSLRDQGYELNGCCAPAAVHCSPGCGSFLFVDAGSFLFVEAVVHFLLISYCLVKTVDLSGQW
jgi:hypothetical protein